MAQQAGARLSLGCKTARVLCQGPRRSRIDDRYVRWGIAMPVGNHTILAARQAPNATARENPARWSRYTVKLVPVGACDSHPGRRLYAHHAASSATDRQSLAA